MTEGKIKIKDIEGDAQQITNLCNNVNFDLNHYLNGNVKKEKISKIWIGMIVPLFFIVCCLIWIGELNPSLNKALILLLFLLLGVVVYIIQHNNENWVNSLIAGITGLCLILISLNIYTPNELAKKLEDKAIESIPKINEDATPIDTTKKDSI